MHSQSVTKKYFPISLYLFLFVLFAITPAGVTTYLSVNSADKIQARAEDETVRRAHAELLKEVLHLGDEISDITTNLAGWDETRTLFVDPTYYNYWRDTRIKDVAQYKGLIDAVDLYATDGKALTTDFKLAAHIREDAVKNPMVVMEDGHIYLVYYSPIYTLKTQQDQLLGYIGVRMNLELAAQTFRNTEHSFIHSIEWVVSDAAALSMETAVAQARLRVVPLPEIKAFADIIRSGFTEYFIYAVALVLFLMVLLSLSIARPLRRLARHLREIYSGQANIIPANFHGVIRIRELEDVRQAINDYKIRFQSATATLEERNKELMRLTYHDPLTGSYNRRAFEARLEHALETAIIEGKHHALCYIDLDQFKVVNDTCGHVAGDELLKQVAILLESEIRESDMLARLGGDEFGVLLEGCGVQQAQVVAEAMRLKVKTHRFAWQDKPFDIGISIGLVPITTENANLSEIWKNADAACYVAKDSGRNRLQIYQEHDKELAQRYGEMQWVSRLKQALNENRFELHAQMIKPVDNANPQVHYEVLLRLREANDDLVLPMAFIPAAERYNLMSDIDRWVIKEALLCIKDLQRASMQDFILSINLSGQSIGNQEILNIIKTEIDANNIEPSQLCFEITETAAMTNLTSAMQFIRSLRALGCKFSLDDFGSGLSSFGYLSNLEVDFIKIDGEFIKSIETNPLSYSIISAINQIGHVMGVKTIAEFVENNEVLSRVANIGIDYVQGYGVHKPEPLHQLKKSKMT